MSIIDVTPAALEAAAAAVPAEQPIVMVNLVRFHAQAQYDQPIDLPPCSGREAYLQRYAPAFRRVMEGKGVEALYVGAAAATMVPEGGESFDAVAVVRYPNFGVLRAMFESEAYQTQAAPHRRAALADWRFILTMPAGR